DYIQLPDPGRGLFVRRQVRGVMYPAQPREVGVDMSEEGVGSMRAVDEAQRSLEDLPGPSPRPFVGNALDFLGKPPWVVLGEYAERYPGGLVRFSLFGETGVLVTDPDLIQETLGDYGRYYKKHPVP